MSVTDGCKGSSLRLDRPGVTLCLGCLHEFTPDDPVGISRGVRRCEGCFRRYCRDRDVNELGLEWVRSAGIDYDGDPLRVLAASERECRGCGRVIYVRGVGVTVCCSDCRQATRRVERADLVCEACGEWFEAARRDAIYCSSACRQRAYRERKRVV